MQSDLTQNVADRLVPLPNRVAGRDGILTLKDESMLIKETTTLELDFYEKSVKYPDFTPFIPTFYGVLRQKSHDESNLNSQTDISSIFQFVCLENITRGFVKPCIMDIKIGFRLYDDFATPAKKQKMINKANSTSSGAIGVRLCGYQTYQVSSQSNHSSHEKNCKLELFKSDPESCRRLTPIEVESKISEFFPKSTIPVDYREYLLNRYLDILEEYLKVLSNLDFRMYSSSLLFVYEIDHDRICSLGYPDNISYHQKSVTSYTESNSSYSNISQKSITTKEHLLDQPSISQSLKYSHMPLPTIVEANSHDKNSDIFQEKNPELPVLKNDKDLAIKHSKPLTLESCLAKIQDCTSSEYSDNDAESYSETESDSSSVYPNSLIELRAIDFAHSTWETPGKGPDEGYLSGLKKLIEILESTLNN
ncbi:Inositol polyphosphate multikinase [Smittium culicis]|uniref:Kinase n=1 Tax=Smittium culicis TaxID=133412 RepID=A0A1R1Y336_9FUNG|nr:Inositol polyphosphate multikinase [Smittium culicis]